MATQTPPFAILSIHCKLHSEYCFSSVEITSSKFNPLLESCSSFIAHLFQNWSLFPKLITWGWQLYQGLFREANQILPGIGRLKFCWGLWHNAFVFRTVKKSGECCCFLVGLTRDSGAQGEFVSVVNPTYSKRYTDIVYEALARCISLPSQLDGLAPFLISSSSLRPRSGM